MRRFTDNIGIACAVMLISSDVNFAVDLSDFKNRKKIHVIVVHGQLASQTLLLCSSEHYLFQDLLKHVPSAISSKVRNLLRFQIINPFFSNRSQCILGSAVIRDV